MAITGKNLSLDGKKSFVPSAYKLKSIDITNYKGDVRDVQNLAVKLIITESLYSPSLVMKLTLKDSTNFIEEFKLTGQETVNVKIAYSQHESDIPRELDLNFYVSEYPLFGSMENQPHTQVYTIVGISEQLFISNQKKISRAFSNNTEAEIKKILVDDLNLPQEKFISTGDAISNAKGIINIQSPFAAVEWFRKQTYDINYSPFFLFQNIHGEYNLLSLSSMIDEDSNPLYQTYFDTRGFNTDAFSEEDYIQRATRIISVASNLKMNKSQQANGGAFASRNNYLNYSDKSYRTHSYSYDSQFFNDNTLEKKPIISNEFVVDDEPLSNQFDSHCEYISVNSMAFENAQETNYNGLSIFSRHFLNAYNSIINTFTHDIKLHGDFALNPGKKINLQFPKAIDPVEYKNFTDESFQIYNQALSGNYLITSCIHTFLDNEYYSEVRVKRDSFSVDL